MDRNKTKPFNQKNLCLLIFQFVLMGAFGISWQHAWASAPEYVPSEVIVKYKDVARLPPEQQAIALQDKSLGVAYAAPYPNLGVTCLHLEPGVSVERVVTEMEADPRVDYAEPNYIRHPVFTPNDPSYSSQYGPQIIDAPDAWNLTLGSSNIVIAIIDTGVDASDPDLGGHILAGIDDSAYPAGQTATGAQHDAIGHGTHVAGIAAAATNNAVGVVGIAGSNTILPIKVFPDNEDASDLAVAQGIRDAADSGAQVINMSLGGSGASSTLQSAVNYAWAKGLVIVAAAGNDSSNEVFYPADANNVIAVSASNSSDGIAGFSNYGSSICVAAPGDTILSTLPGNTYGYYSGTSMASPFVAGVAGLAFAYVPAATNSAVVAAIKAGADKVGAYTYDSTGRNDYYGYGRVNAYKTLLALRAPASIVVSPSSASVNAGKTQPFTAVGYDQYGNQLPAAQQPTFAWSVSGGGTISSSGLFTAGSVAGGPFTVKATAGNISGTALVTIIANVVSTGQITFYPRPGWASRMAGGKFQVSQDNITYTDVYTLSSAPQEGTWTTVPVGLDLSQYRYLRYISAAGGYGNIAELQFYSGTGSTAVKLTGIPFGPVGPYQNPGRVPANAFDGNVNSFNEYSAAGPQFVGIDRGANFTSGFISWNGTSSYLLGADYPWWNYGTDFGTGNWGKYTDWNAIASNFATMSSQGVHVVRWWVFGDGRYSPDFNSDGTVSGLDGSVFSDVDQALQIAANNHITLLLTLMDGGMWSTASYSNGNNGTTVQIGGHAAIITDPTTQQTFLDNALKPLLQHIASSGNKNAVLGYDVVNEPESQMSSYWGGANFSTSSVQSFVGQCTNYIHTYGGGAYATVGSASPAYVGTWKGLGLDFYQVHYYPWMDNGGAAGSGLPTYASLGLDKPCIVGEFATVDGSYGLTDTNPLSAEWYLDTIYNDGYAGALAWSYNAGDSATNWTSFQPVFTKWAANHHSIIGP